ncbi:MAG: hypothetical protein WC823_03025 [Parcubacteria group bacterium]|jgi:hypothetical protein
MEYLKWLKKLDAESQGKYIEFICPYFENGKCVIYAKRFACCRNFPQTNGYCSQNKICSIIKNKIKNNTPVSSEACGQCRKACCEKILVPAQVEITKEFIEKWMNITCADCRKFF